MCEIDLFNYFHKNFEFERFLWHIYDQQRSGYLKIQQSISPIVLHIFLVHHGFLSQKAKLRTFIDIFRICIRWPCCLANKKILFFQVFYKNFEKSKNNYWFALAHVSALLITCFLQTVGIETFVRKKVKNQSSFQENSIELK